MENFEKLVLVLIDLGYNVDVEDHYKFEYDTVTGMVKKSDKLLYKSAEVTGKGIVCAFCSEHPSVMQGASDITVNGGIVMDNEKCFVAYSESPLIFNITKNDKEIEFMINKLIFFESDEGYKHSKEYHELRDIVKKS